MTAIIIGLISAVVLSIVTQFLGDDPITRMMYAALDLEHHIPDTTNAAMVQTMFGNVTEIFYNLGISLLVLKFLVKGFGIYSLWTDGDPEADPCGYLVNFIKAIAIATGFKYVYNFAASTSVMLLEQILNTVDSVSGGETWTKIAGAIGSLNIVAAILNLIFFAGILILYLKFIARGLEIIVMKIGVPVACMGVLDNDGGIFREYSMQFARAVFTTIVQCTLAKSGLWFMAADGNAVMAVACMLAAHSVPKLLQAVLISTGGGNPVGAAYHAATLVSAIKSVAAKGA